MIFRRQLIVETSLPPREAWKVLLPVVKTDQPPCNACGQPHLEGTHYCSRCGQPQPPPLPTTATPQFEGTVSPQQFEFTRIINYRNSCIPVITGRFEPTPTGTRIVIDMTMHPFGWVFLVGGGGISFIVLSTLALDNQSMLAILAFIGPLFIGGICHFAFTSEANTADAILSYLWPL